MDILRIKTERLLITQFDMSMITSLHLNSLDDDNRKFVPDEVFETMEKAHGILEWLIECYNDDCGPFVYPILLADNENIGYVQAVPLENENWEVGYHIAKKYTGNGYATEAVNAFLPIIMKHLEIAEIWGVCRTDNIASCKVLEKSGFILQNKSVIDYHGEQHDVCKYLYTQPVVMTS
jgi:RimJ/RimL family protein N-acetyltransferase